MGFVIDAESALSTNLNLHDITIQERARASECQRDQSSFLAPYTALLLSSFFKVT